MVTQPPLCIDLYSSQLEIEVQRQRAPLQKWN